MAMIHRHLLLILAVHCLSTLTSSTVHSAPSFLSIPSPFAACADGSIEQCLDAITDEDEFEFDFDSEINRRILTTAKYISYGALNKNSVPCSRRGASYYNCRPGASGNPYTRGCSAITRCRGG